METPKISLSVVTFLRAGNRKRHLRSTSIRTHMRQYCPARAEEDEQCNVHADESEDVIKEEEEDLDEIMGKVREALTMSFPG